MISEFAVQGGVGFYNICFTLGLDWFRDDGISVMVKKYHEIFAAAAGRDWKTACLVCGYLARELDSLNEDLVGAGGGGVRTDDRREKGRDGLSRREILVVLEKVAFGSCHILGKVLPNKLGGKCGPGGVISGVDGFCPC